MGLGSVMREIASHEWLSGLTDDWIVPGCGVLARAGGSYHMIVGMRLLSRDSEALRRSYGCREWELDILDCDGELRVWSSLAMSSSWFWRDCIILVDW